MLAVWVVVTLRGPLFDVFGSFAYASVPVRTIVGPEAFALMVSAAVPPGAVSAGPLQVIAVPDDGVHVRPPVVLAIVPPVIERLNE